MSLSSHSAPGLSIDAVSDVKGARIAIISTEWNEKIIHALNEGATRILDATGAEVVYRLEVPGAFEISFGVRLVYDYFADAREEEMPEAIIAFGAVIRGGTPHFEYVSKAVTDSIAQHNFAGYVPVIFGVLTLDNEEQAWERLGGTHGHKGEEAAVTALKMIRLHRSVKKKMEEQKRPGIGFQREQR